jgi:hypothetical protein
MTKEELDTLLTNRKHLSGYSLNEQGNMWEITLNFGPNTSMVRATDLQEASEKITNTIIQHRLSNK